MHPLLRTSLIGAALSLGLSCTAQAKDFSFAGRTMSCKEAGTYRDTTLFAEFASAVDNFDATREQRIQATIQAFQADVASLTQDMDKADSARRRKIAVAVAGVVLGKAADRMATVGIKPGLSQAEQQALKAVAGRGAEWTSVFAQYGTGGEVDVADIAAMPFTLLLAFSPFNTAEKVWSLGKAGIDIAVAVAEAEIIKGEAKLTAATTQQRAQDLARKLQMPRIAEINRLKNAIDKQCG